MDLPKATRLEFDDHRTTLSGGTTPQAVLAVGIGDLASKVFRHDPPAPYEMEQAIDLVEDALTATGLKRAVRADLLISDEPLCALLVATRAAASRVKKWKPSFSGWRRFRSATLACSTVCLQAGAWLRRCWCCANVCTTWALQAWCAESTRQLAAGRRPNQTLE